MYRGLIGLLVIWMIYPFALFAADDTWNQAAEAYRSENYVAALELYASLEDEKPSDELYYNIANCHYKLGAIPHAILYYEKALKRNPRNRQAEDNLELARSKMDEPVIGIESFFLVRWVRGAALSFSPMGWGLLSLVILWAMAYAYGRSIRTKRDLRLRERIISALMLVIVLSLGYISYHNSVRTDYAIIMDDTILKEAPDEMSPTSRRLEGGEKVHVLDQLDGYHKVRLINYEVGWIPDSVLRPI